MLIRYLGGEVMLSFSSEDMREVFEVLALSDVPFRELSRTDEEISLLVPLYRKKKLLRSMEERGITAEVGGIRGLPRILYNYRKRVGIPIGFLIIVVMVWLSGRVIWTVNVEGNKNVSDAEIIELLEKLGCGVGDTYEDIDFDTLHNRFLMESDGIAWIAVNMNGTHANVEVRETVSGNEEEEDGKGFYNIVATEDGQIERIAATEGKPVVEINDTVMKGELLISGAITYKEIYNRFESADGSVYARVNRSFEVNVPLEREVKEYTGEKIEKKTLRFFKFNINLFVNSRIPYEFCDKIAVNKQIYLFDSIPLPLYVNKTVYSEYVPASETMTEREAADIAMAEYRRKLVETLGEAELLSKTVSESFDGETYTVKCRLVCLADIAKKVPLELSRTEDAENKETETE